MLGVRFPRAVDREHGGFHVSYRRDWRYPAAEAERMREAITATGGDARHLVLDSAMGHGAFLYDLGDLAARVSGFLGAPAP